MKFMRVLCVLAMVIGLTAVAYAETQSVKVSGDLAVRSIFRNSYDYQRHPNEPAAAVGLFLQRTGLTTAQQSWWMSTTELQVDADMTDNVSTCVRLANQRDWGVTAKAVDENTALLNGLGGYTADENEFDVGVELAYVTLKDFIYSPLTLTIGRQRVWLGKGFIVGQNRLNPGWDSFNLTGGLTAPEYTVYDAFDGVKAVLDYNPWTLTGIYFKIWDNAVQDLDDVNLWGTNVGYKFEQYKAEAEGYWFFKQDNATDKWNTTKANNDIHNLGLRGSFDPIDAITINLEGAYQFGNYVGSRMQTWDRHRSAWACDMGFEWRYLAERFSWKPKLGAEYIFYSGNEPEERPDVTPGDYNGWDPMYRGKFDSAIREFVGTYYASAKFPWRAATGNWYYTTGDAAYQNQHQVVFRGSVQPIESLTLKGNLNLFWTVEDAELVGAGGNYTGAVGGYLGTEVDLEAIWDYTEDVSFGLLGAWYFPSKDDVYEDNCATATDIVGTVKVNF